MSQRVAIITGAGRGIGKAVARLFLQEGYAVVIADVSSSYGRAAEKNLSAIGDALFIPNDVSKEAEVQRMNRQTVSRFGGIDVLINNAANINLAPIRATMSELDGATAYAASKGGIVALTHALALELGPQVRVNCISPGWIDTGKEKISAKDHAAHPAGRVGRPDDVASLALFLAAKENDFMTGRQHGDRRRHLAEDGVLMIS